MHNINQKLTVSNISSPILVESIRTRQTANIRIVNFMAHAITMLDTLHNQNQAVGLTSQKLDHIYKEAESQINKINHDLVSLINQPHSKKEKESNQIQKKLENAQAKAKKTMKSLRM